MDQFERKRCISACVLMDKRLRALCPLAQRWLTLAKIICIFACFQGTRIFTNQEDTAASYRPIDAYYISIHLLNGYSVLSPQ